MVSGIDLIRKKEHTEVSCVTCPLLTTYDGKKLGKTSTGQSLWLDPDLLSPYDYWQHWRNTSDADVENFLKMFTFVPLESIDTVISRSDNYVQAKILLADEATSYVHGTACLPAIHETVHHVFQNNTTGHGTSSSSLPQKLWSELTSKSQETLSLLEIILAFKWATSKSQARQLIREGAVKIDGDIILNELHSVQKKSNIDSYMIQVGKKHHGIIHVNL
jgi:tyrosyl-tRNA synthetase